MSTTPEQEETAVLRLRLAPRFKERIEAAAAAHQVSVSALTRLALVEYLDRRNIQAPDGKEAA